MLRLGVQGVAAGWRTPRALADRDSRLDKERLNELISRARRQSDTLEELRVLASSKAFHTARTFLEARRSEDPAGTPPMCVRPVNHGEPRRVRLDQMLTCVAGSGAQICVICAPSAQSLMRCCAKR